MWLPIIFYFFNPFNKVKVYLLFREKNNQNYKCNKDFEKKTRFFIFLV